jgi:uracil phosphoribosyltransferase
MYRNKQSLLPVQYYNKLLKECNADAAIILEPVMATGRFQLQVVVAGNVANEGFALLIPFS